MKIGAGGLINSGGENSRNSVSRVGGSSTENVSSRNGGSGGENSIRGLGSRMRDSGAADRIGSARASSNGCCPRLGSAARHLLGMGKVAFILVPGLIIGKARSMVTNFVGKIRERYSSSGGYNFSGTNGPQTSASSSSNDSKPLKSILKQPGSSSSDGKHVHFNENKNTTHKVDPLGVEHREPGEIDEYDTENMD